MAFVFGNPRTLIIEGDKSGKWAEGEEKSHFLVSSNQINWEKIWVYQEEYVSAKQRAV